MYFLCFFKYLWETIPLRRRLVTSKPLKLCCHIIIYILVFYNVRTRRIVPAAGVPGPGRVVLRPQASRAAQALPAAALSPLRPRAPHLSRGRRYPVLRVLRAGRTQEELPSAALQKVLLQRLSRCR